MTTQERIEEEMAVLHFGVQHCGLHYVPDELTERLEEMCSREKKYIAQKIVALIDQARKEGEQKVIDRLGDIDLFVANQLVSVMNKEEVSNAKE